MADIAHEVVKYGKVCEVVVPRPGRHPKNMDHGVSLEFIISSALGQCLLRAYSKGNCVA